MNLECRCQPSPQVLLTLHAEPPKPLPPGRLLRALLAVVAVAAPAEEAGGEAAAGEGCGGSAPPLSCLDAACSCFPCLPYLPGRVRLVPPGEVRVRLRLSTRWGVEPALPLRRGPGGERLTGLQVGSGAGGTGRDGLCSFLGCIGSLPRSATTGPQLN
jgi:hypothetical protein